MTKQEMEKDSLDKRGQLLLELLDDVLRAIQSTPDSTGAGEYKAYLHGQAYGLAVALKTVFPGPENLGEKAAKLSRPVITEFNCECRD